MTKRVLLFALACIALLSSYSLAEEKDSNQRISIYIHPVSILLSAYMTAISQEPYFYLEFTGEIPFGKYSSIVVVPSVYKDNSGFVTDGDVKSFKVGSGIGVRLFPNGKTEGFYFQFMPGVYYVKKEHYYISDELNYTQYGVYADVFSYIGYSLKFYKFSMFLDAGVGLGYPPPLNIPSLPQFDINFGIGIPL